MKEAHPEEAAGFLTETTASAAAQNVRAALPVYPGMVLRLAQIRGRRKFQNLFHIVLITATFL